MGFALGSRPTKHVTHQALKRVGDPNFTAEESILKGMQESEGNRLYGKLGSIRIDALQRIKDSKIICVYDIKTGRSRLTPARVQEIAANVFKAFGDAKYFVIIEVKPTVRR